MTVCFHYSILFMKLWSYIQVNMWCRNEFNDIPAKSRTRSKSITIAELRKEKNMFSVFNTLYNNNNNQLSALCFPSTLVVLF